ncbi:hypothetical protein MMIC_P2191 [Mariprofundus micogutta]|uniref:Uncharacterized protein n=1 Tax=Mariprofundus micogutta TaxID=1921010 RepID=A0A1L8CQL6_9PROT|nr:hypothetical protein MMIC_P2191 [Mariprofundus micogutta]
MAYFWQGRVLKEVPCSDFLFYGLPLPLAVLQVSAITAHGDNIVIRVAKFLYNSRIAFDLIYQFKLNFQKLMWKWNDAGFKMSNGIESITVDQK